jgi:hypothetical protein
MNLKELKKINSEKLDTSTKGIALEPLEMT